MIIGDIGIRELGTMLQLDFQALFKLLAGNLFRFSSHCLLDDPGIFLRNLGFIELAPILDPKFLADPLHFLFGNLFWDFHIL